MPRRNSPKPDDSRPLGGGVGWARTESGPDGDWLVRAISGAQAQKTYRCPGCDHEIRPGVAHVVAWPARETGSVEERRHWHQACWNSRGRRWPAARRW
ncbi:hypothetical protein SK571_30005 [Lentzea sp. BCCO 10_0798]|uniref:ATP/GTP-binding protein n=1 Tax=Lentzea kristufekii TaxID=3095430 RepID=A0ABU4U0T0_9PSEU|nr:hypothetical protein [Lentzea sp. BCCO 10_0798]MDX8053626.1 hypothetical protein [Lentzea sp. BCCO 10_0798]